MGRPRERYGYRDTAAASAPTSLPGARMAVVSLGLRRARRPVRRMAGWHMVEDAASMSAHTIEEQRLDIDRMHIRWALPDYRPRCHMPNCGELLNAWALKHGFAFCSKDCREAARA